MKILLIDDEAFALKLLVRQLEVQGITDVALLQNAAEALVLLSTDGECFNIVFCDLQMPGVDGIEFMRALAQTKFVGDLVLVSGEDARILQTAERLARAHGLRVLGSLEKPVSPAGLQRVLKAHADRAAVRPRAEHRTYSPAELRLAITAGEIIAFCQPKVSLATGRLTGVEMLARWQHAEDGLVFPDQFIEVAESHGLIDMLTRTMLSGALAQAKRWRESGLECRIAVNLSMDNLNHPQFADFVMVELAQAGVPSSELVLEVTESRLMQDARSALDVLTRLRLKRVELSIDDFGTGHSSLAQLRDLPFNELKIDRSFVHGACRAPHLAAILTASLDMAKNLGMRSVAEGVEDIDDWNFLRQSGCDIAQGYFIARPMPTAALGGWLLDWEQRRRDLVLIEP